MEHMNVHPNRPSVYPTVRPSASFFQRHPMSDQQKKIMKIFAASYLYQGAGAQFFNAENHAMDSFIKHRLPQALQLKAAIEKHQIGENDFRYLLLCAGAEHFQPLDQGSYTAKLLAIPSPSAVPYQADLISYAAKPLAR
jgi:hypothetical protein